MTVSVRTSDSASLFETLSRLNTPSPALRSLTDKVVGWKWWTPGVVRENWVTECVKLWMLQWGSSLACGRREKVTNRHENSTSRTKQYPTVKNTPHRRNTHSKTPTSPKRSWYWEVIKSPPYLSSPDDRYICWLLFHFIFHNPQSVWIILLLDVSLYWACFITIINCFQRWWIGFVNISFI